MPIGTYCPLSESFTLSTAKCRKTLHRCIHPTVKRCRESLHYLQASRGQLVNPGLASYFSNSRRKALHFRFKARSQVPAVRVWHVDSLSTADDRHTTNHKCNMTKLMNTMRNDTHCADCGAAFIKTECAPGYAILPDKRKVCYACAGKRQIEDLKDRSKPVIGYVGSDDSITTWTGVRLMTITRAWLCQLTRPSFTHDRRGYLSIHAVDVHGGHWAGRGSEGIAIKMRPVKPR